MEENNRIIMHNRTKGNGLKLKEGRFRLDFRWKFFTWDGEALALLPRAVGAPTLEALKARLAGALGS